MRYKGYPLDGAEEVLKKKLTELEKAASDPALEARSNEIWARMHNIRVRITLIQGEAERLGKKIGNGEEKIDNATMAAIKKVCDSSRSKPKTSMLMPHSCSATMTVSLITSRRSLSVSIPNSQTGRKHLNL